MDSSCTLLLLGQPVAEAASPCPHSWDLKLVFGKNKLKVSSPLFQFYPNFYSSQYFYGGSAHFADVFFNLHNVT